MEDTLPARVRLRGFEFDLQTGELFGSGPSVRLSDKPRRLLNILIEHGNELVTRREIQQQLWPNDTIVDFEQGINTVIKTVRQLLGDTAEEPRYIETIPRRGYRLLAPVEAVVTTPLGVVAEQAPASLVGRRFSHYRVLDVIGGGGMGMVYGAEDLKLGRRVALKFLPQELARDPVALQRFEREARTASALNHPNICTIYDIEECEEQPVLVMELLEGETVRDRLATLAGEQKKLPTYELLNIAIQICDGLQAAHEKGILHRDVKPANIFITVSGQAKILDFGLAKLLLHGGKEPDPDAETMTSAEIPPLISSARSSEASSLAYGSEDTLTRTGIAVGTAGYMSPEQVRGEKLDARSDLFSFGLVLYEMAGGQRAFSGETAAQVHDAILHDSPVSLRELNAAVPAKLVGIIDRTVEKDRERRYQTAADIRIDLQAVQRRRNRAERARLWIATGATVVILLAITAGLLLRGRIWKQLPASMVMENKSIAVLSFRNMSGDASLNWLDNGLPELLTTNLSQVKGMDVLSREQVSRAIKRKGQQDAAELPPDAALDVARDAGADAFVTGSLMKLGTSKLRVDLHVQDTRTGKILYSDKVESEDINGIFAMVDAMTARLAERTLPASQLLASTPQVADVMTSNVGAMRHYQAGEDYRQEYQCEKALREYEEAVRLDQQFAMAYYGMSVCYDVVSNETKSVETVRIAEGLASRLPRAQRLMIQAWRAERLGDEDGHIQAAEELAREAPRVGPFYLAGALYGDDAERGVAVEREAIALDSNNPELYNMLAYEETSAGHEAAALEACDQYQAHLGANEPNVWDTRGDVLFTFGRDEEAVAAYRHALELDPDFDGGITRAELALTYADQGNYDLATAELHRYGERVTGFSQLQFPAFEAELPQAKGMPERALPLYANTVLAFLQAGQASNAVEALRLYASLAFLLGQEQPGLAFARQQKLPNEQEEIAVSLLEAASGNEAGAEAALQQYAEANPDIPARVIENRRAWNAALVALRSADRDTALRISPKLKMGNWPWPEGYLVRGRIRLLAKDYAGAERELKRAIAYDRSVRQYPMILLTEQLSHFYLGQVYEQTGKREDAIREYQKFLAPYAKYNSRLPQIAEARAALKRMQG